MRPDRVLPPGESERAEEGPAMDMACRGAPGVWRSAEPEQGVGGWGGATAERCATFRSPTFLNFFNDRLSRQRGVGPARAAALRPPYACRARGQQEARARVPRRRAPARHSTQAPRRKQQSTSVSDASCVVMTTHRMSLSPTPLSAKYSSWPLLSSGAVFQPLVSPRRCANQFQRFALTP